MAAKSIASLLQDGTLGTPSRIKWSYKLRQSLRKRSCTRAVLRASLPVSKVSRKRLIKMPVSMAVAHAIVSAAKVDLQTLSHAPLLQSITLTFSRRPFRMSLSARRKSPPSCEHTLELARLARAPFRPPGPVVIRPALSSSAVRL